MNNISAHCETVKAAYSIRKIKLQLLTCDNDWGAAFGKNILNTICRLNASVNKSCF